MERMKKKRGLLAGVVALILIVAGVALAGLAAYRPGPAVIQGEAEATDYRISGKVPGRIEKFLAEEGQYVHKGDTLVVIDSPELRAKIAQATALRNAAEAQNRKVGKGARQEQVAAAYELWQQAAAGEEIAQKTFGRMQRLYEEKVISAQKYDEAAAGYKAAKAICASARSQYEMAVNGARQEDRETAEALAKQAEEALKEAESYLSELYLTSPADGAVTAIYPRAGELAGQGAPLMTVTDLDDIWFTFNIREDMLEGLRTGDRIRVRIPALGDGKTWEAEVYFMAARESYATWRATRDSGSFDARTFEVRARPSEKIDGLRPGMTAIVSSME